MLERAGDVAIDFYNNFASDLQLVKEAGFGHFRCHRQLGLTHAATVTAITTETHITLRVDAGYLGRLPLQQYRAL